MGADSAKVGMYIVFMHLGSCIFCQIIAHTCLILEYMIRKQRNTTDMQGMRLRFPTIHGVGNTRPSNQGESDRGRAASERISEER